MRLNYFHIYLSRPIIYFFNFSFIFFFLFLISHHPPYSNLNILNTLTRNQ